jgi:hypothetical protein
VAVEDVSPGTAEVEGSGAVRKAVERGTGRTLGVPLMAMRPSSSLVGCATGAVATSIVPEGGGGAAIPLRPSADGETLESSVGNSGSVNPSSKKRGIPSKSASSESTSMRLRPVPGVAESMASNGDVGLNDNAGGSLALGGVVCTAAAKAAWSADASKSNLVARSGKMVVGGRELCIVVNAEASCTYGVGGAVPVLCDAALKNESNVRGSVVAERSSVVGGICVDAIPKSASSAVDGGAAPWADAVGAAELFAILEVCFMLDPWDGSVASMLMYVCCKAEMLLLV